MSQGKPPFDPFGSNERTVIRPNPGGRRVTPAPTPPGSQPGPPPDEAWFPAGPQPGQEPRPGTASPGFDMAPPSPAPVIAPPRHIDLGSLRDLDVPDVNPIMRSARPLLVLLSNLRVSGTHQKVALLMESVAQAIVAFERDLVDAQEPQDQIVTAKYALCATADDIVQNIPGAERHLWTQYSMLSRFFQARTSGVGFFDELARFKANPALNYDLLELMHACLSLGFEGQYRSTGGGDLTLQQIRRDLYYTLRHVRARVTEEISPHWQGQEIATEVSSSRVPVWVVASVAGIVLLGVFLVLRILLSDAAEAFAERMINLHPSGEISLARTVYEPFDTTTIEARSTQLQRIRAALADDISRNRLTVDPKGQYIGIRLLNDVLFESGSADVKPPVHDLLSTVAQVLDREPKEIRVVGHTDSVPLRSTVRFKSNNDLASHRARAVAEIMAPHLQDRDRLVIEGRGPDEPIASNATPEGRAMNRRVEVLLTRSD
jgi:type VI secretion system protein ImpK